MLVDQAELGHYVLKIMQRSPRKAACVEWSTCPYCGFQMLAVHDFVESVVCHGCKRSHSVRAPDWPLDGEPRAVDWEEAVLDVSAHLPKVGCTIRDMAFLYASKRDSPTT